MELYAGARVRTPSGETGMVVNEKVHDRLHFYYWHEAKTKRSGQALLVLLDSGEVRFFTEHALSEPIEDTDGVGP